jgi:hypothetical protein
MLKGVITPVPQKGDLIILSDWKPITVLNPDYKLITIWRTKLVCNQQNFHTKLRLIRDVTECTSQKNLLPGVMSLDQASAYDFTKQPYIYHILRKSDLVRRL